MTISEVTRRSSRPGPGVLFGDEVRYVQAAVDALLAKGIGRIILLSHYGYEIPCPWPGRSAMWM